MMKNKNGFTLIELLAVIVILALLVLVATPAITNIMQSSAKSNFKNEVMGMVSNVSTAFTSKSAKKVISIDPTKDTITDLKTNIYNVTVGGKGYAYLCMSLDDLVNEQYMSKSLGDTYAGYIQMWVPDFNGETITFVNVTNGRYFLQGRTSKISDDSFSASQSAVATGLTKPTYENNKRTGCPNTYSIPAESVLNPQS